ncbi:TIGR02453 family protein [Sulfurospirillum arcachonense]|uniref:TIGR02453 family protein n=1 Tax=Sulfurospirillum arcachonense TaxID=57666 RepID=UPI000469268D|nr:DUF2461 domain-containing protein [Sulfurospirillum arcachonense]
MQFKGFSKKGIEFLKELEVNNTKAWFENHRSIWEKEILLPNTNFVQEMGETLQILVPTIHFKPKVSGSLFRIYRDVRFSKDKTPMKSKIGLLFWQGQAHRMQSSSFYMHYDKQSYFVASGIRNFKPPLLKTYREYIKNKNKRESLHVILEELKTKGYLLPELKYKRVPQGFDKDAEHIYLSRFGAMFAYQEFMIDDVFFKDEIVDKVFKIYEDMSELQQWVYEMSLTLKDK